MFNNCSILDNILEDLRPIILEYIRTYPLFAIGKYRSTYEGYRIVNKSDMDNPYFVKLLANSYRDNIGLYSLDDSDGDILGINGYILGIGVKMNENFLRTEYFANSRWHHHKIKKGEIVPFYIYCNCDMLMNIDNVKYFCRDHYIRKIGLFVKNDFIWRSE